jgi:hypothetical protein
MTLDEVIARQDKEDKAWFKSRDKFFHLVSKYTVRMQNRSHDYGYWHGIAVMMKLLNLKEVPDDVR